MTKNRFQQYVDAAKKETIPWNIFKDLMEDLSYDVDQLRNLNAILLTELTMNSSTLDKLKYLNVLLMSEFKNYIIREKEIEENDFHEDLQTSKEISTENEIQKLTDNEISNEKAFVNESKENFLQDLQRNKEISTENETQTHVDYQILSEETFVNEIKENVLQDLQKSKEISTDNQVQRPVDDQIFHEDTFVNEIEINLNDSYKAEIIEGNSSETNSKIFLCKICNREFRIYFHLKQHIKKVHEAKENFSTQFNTKNDENIDYENSKSIPSTTNLKANVHSHHNTAHKNRKCEFCGKSFSSRKNLKRHIHTVHEGHKDYKCKSCYKSFSLADTLKFHIK